MAFEADLPWLTIYWEPGPTPAALGVTSVMPIKEKDHRGYFDILLDS